MQPTCSRCGPAIERRAEDQGPTFLSILFASRRRVKTLSGPFGERESGRVTAVETGAASIDGSQSPTGCSFRLTRQSTPRRRARLVVSSATVRATLLAVRDRQLGP
jgi:hypothetical protein